MIFKDKKNNRILNRRGIAGQQAIDRQNSGVKRFSRFIFFLLFFLFLATSAYMIFFSGFMEIKQVSVSGTEDLDPIRISGFVKDSFSGKFLNIIPKNNYILISKKRIEKLVFDQFKKVESAEVGITFPDSIFVNIKERRSVLLWCSAGPCYFIDENGIAYEWANLESEEIESRNLIRLSDSSEKPVQVGEKIMDSTNVDFVSSVKSELKDNFDIEAGGEFQTSSKIAGDFQIRTENETKIFFSLADNLRESITKLKIFFEKEFKKEDIGKLEYIDLRSENRVYYKIKDEEKNEKEDVENADSENVESEKENKDDNEKE